MTYRAEDWKPGDVAMLTWSVNADGPFAAVRAVGRWFMLDYLNPSDPDFLSDRWLGAVSGVTARRLVVIDPDSAEDRERLADVLAAHPRDLQAALREFANPKPPRPEEPTGFGAKVRDARGNVWLRTASRPLRSWRLDDELTASATWDEIDAVEVIA